MVSRSGWSAWPYRTCVYAVTDRDDASSNPTRRSASPTVTRAAPLGPGWASADRQARTRRAPRTGHREHPATHAGQPPPTPAAPRRHQDHPHQRPFPGLTAAARMPTYSRRMPDQLPAMPLRHRRLRPPVPDGVVLRLRDPRRTPGLRARPTSTRTRPVSAASPIRNPPPRRQFW
jgi:hypothetical protein